MKGHNSRVCGALAAVVGALLAVAAPGTALAQYQSPPPSSAKMPAPQPDSKKKAEEPVTGAEFSKEFRKQASKVQKLVTDAKWAEVLAALPALEALPSLNKDEIKVLATWRLQATQATGDTEAFIAVLELFLKEGYATPEQIGPMNQQLAANYNAKKDRVKTLQHYRLFIDATPDADANELETLGRLYLQNANYAEAAQWLGKAIDVGGRGGAVPPEPLFQLRDKCFVELKDPQQRLDNLEALVKLYPNKEYYSRIVAIYQTGTRDERVVMLNAYRLAVTDPQGGLATVGGYLGYADTALVAGSPGEAARGLERGMKDGVVPSVGSNQVALQDAKAAVVVDRKNLPADSAAAAKNPKGEFDVKVGLGYYSAGDYEKTIEVVQRGIAKGGVGRLDDANLLLGAALLELGRRDEARAAFQAAAVAAGGNTHMARIAGMWLARVERMTPAPAGG